MGELAARHALAAPEREQFKAKTENANRRRSLEFRIERLKADVGAFEREIEPKSLEIERLRLATAHAFIV